MSKQILNKYINVGGVNIFYREAGEPKNPAVLLLHGFPTSSIMFKNLMVALAENYYLVAPDFPGFGFSDFPEPTAFKYTFNNISSFIGSWLEKININSYVIYLHDYGCPVGLQLCLKNPEKIKGLIVQSGNAYEQGLGPEWNETKDYWENPTEEKKKKVAAFLSEEGVKMQYTAGIPDDLLSRISPESWIVDWHQMQRPGNREMQFELNCDYRNHIFMFPEYHKYFRKYQPPALIIWGKHDAFFNFIETDRYKEDLPNAQVHILNGGHMALETNFDKCMDLISGFLARLKDKPDQIGNSVWNRD